MGKSAFILSTAHDRKVMGLICGIWQECLLEFVRYPPSKGNEFPPMTYERIYL